MPGKLKVISANTMYLNNKNKVVPDCNVMGSPNAGEIVLA